MHKVEHSEIFISSAFNFFPVVFEPSRGEEEHEVVIESFRGVLMNVVKQTDSQSVRPYPRKFVC